MGWCHEFGSHIREGCGHPMVAGQSSCSCAQCGVECPGKFTACTTVWDRGPRQVTIVRAPATEAPREVVPSRVQHSTAPAAEAGRAQPVDRVEATLAGVLAEVRLLHDAVTHQQRSNGQPHPEPSGATERLVQLSTELPNRVGSAVRRALEMEREAARQANNAAPDIGAQLRELLPRYIGPVMNDALRQALAPLARRVEEVSAEVQRLGAAPATSGRGSDPSPRPGERRERPEWAAPRATGQVPPPMTPDPVATTPRPAWQHRPVDAGAAARPEPAQVLPPAPAPSTPQPTAPVGRAGEGAAEPQQGPPEAAGPPLGPSAGEVPDQPDQPVPEVAAAPAASAEPREQAARVNGDEKPHEGESEGAGRSDWWRRRPTFPSHSRPR